MKRIIISILATFIVIILLFIFFMSTKVSILLNLDKVYLYQTEDNKIQVYRSDLFEPKDLNPTKLIKTINQKHSIYLLGNNYDNYIDARGVASSYVYIFGYGGDDVLIGSQGPDNIHGHEGHDLLVGCNGTDKIYGDDGNNYLITGAGGEYIDSNDSISYGCKLSDLANDLLNSDLSKFNKVPWYYIKAKEALGLSEEEFNTLKTQSSQPQNIINQMPQSKGSNDFSIELNTYNDPVLAKKNKAIFERLLQEANNGKAFSQYNLSKMYVWGEGTNKDENKSIFWLTKSASNNEFFAQRDLAFFRATGKLLPRDFEEALYWNFKALSNPVMQNYELAFQKNLLPQVQKDILNQERNNLVALLTQLIKKLTPAQFNKVMKRTDKDFGQKDIVNIRNESHLELTLPTNWGLVSATHQGILTAYIFVPVDRTLEAYNNDFSFSHATMPSILPYNQYANLAKVQTQNFECNETKSFNEQSVQDSQGGNYSFEVLCKKGSGYRYILNKMILRDKDLFRLIKIFNIKNEDLDSLPKNELTQWRSIMNQTYACSDLLHDCKHTSSKPQIALSRMILYY